MKFNNALAALPFLATLAAAAPTPTKRANFLDGQSVATWWGQDTHELSDLCADPSFDIIMLSFLNQLNPPALNLAGHAGGPSAAQKAKGWGNLIDGTIAPTGSTSIADQITQCQTKQGKKVMVSFGGDETKSNAKFADSAAATQSANQLWSLLLGGTDTSVVPANTRPFGKVVLDGVDLDNETGQSANYETFVNQLRSLMNGDKSKTYYISGSPQVTDLDSHDGSIPDSIYPNLDFVNVQFYNNAQDSGELGHPDFVQTVGQWNDKIKALSSKTKLMVAAPVSTLAATGHDVGVQSASQIASDIASVKSKSYSQFGGMSLWAGGWAIDNDNWQRAVKSALTGSKASTATSSKPAPSTSAKADSTTQTNQLKAYCKTFGSLVASSDICKGVA